MLFFHAQACVLAGGISPVIENAWALFAFMFKLKRVSGEKAIRALEKRGFLESGNAKVM